MSYEAWRQGVALGTRPDWDEDRACYVGEPSARVADRACCVDRLVNDPPTAPGQRCRCGRLLPWYDPQDPERGFQRE